MLADVQERLVYRTTVYIRSDILASLEMMKRVAEPIKEEEEREEGPGNIKKAAVSLITTGWEWLWNTTFKNTFLCVQVLRWRHLAPASPPS